MYPPSFPPFSQGNQQGIEAQSTFQSELPDGSVSQPLMNPLPATTHFRGFPQQAMQSPGFPTQQGAFQQGGFQGQIPMFRPQVSTPFLNHPIFQLLFGRR